MPERGEKASEEGSPEDLLPGAAIGYRHLIESLPAITHLSRLDPAASTIYISPQVEALTGYPSDEWIARPTLWTELLHPDDRARMLAANEAHIRRGMPISEEYRLITRTGRTISFHEESRVVRGEDGRLVGSQGILLDITDRKRAEQTLRLQANLQRRLVEELVRAQEAERMRMARLIHDEAIQILAAVGMRVELLAGKGVDPSGSAGLRDTAQAVRDAIARLRTLMSELEPPALEREGLVGAIRLHLREVDEPVQWEIEDHLSEDPPLEIRLIAYRIAQEAVSNVRKHARARNATIRFGTSEDGVLVTVRDDGIGFDPGDPEAIPLGNRGLASIRHRAEAVGGWSELRSTIGEGTTVTFWLPTRSGSVPATDG